MDIPPPGSPELETISTPASLPCKASSMLEAWISWIAAAFSFAVGMARSLSFTAINPVFVLLSARISTASIRLALSESSILMTDCPAIGNVLIS